MKKTFLLSMLLIALLMVPLTGVKAEKETAKTINYAGNLFDYQGKVINRSVAMTFKIYNSENGGSALWTEPHYNVAVSNGYFSVNLGTETPLNLPFNEKYWVEVEVDGNQYPRVQFTNVPYSFVSLRSFRADTSDVAKALADKGLTVGMMSDAARTITGDIEGTYPNLFLRAGAVVGNIGQGEITNFHISPSVTTPPSGPAGGALTGQYPNPKIAENAIETHTIAPGAVTYSKIQDADGYAGTILVWNGNAWAESTVSAWEVDGEIGNEVIWASAGLEILNNGNGLGVGIMEGGVTNDMLAGLITGDKLVDGTIPMDKFENGDVHGQIMWWDNTAKAWRMTKAKPNENNVLKFQYDADETAYNVAWGKDGMNIPFAYVGSSLGDNNYSQTMLKLTLDGTQTPASGNDINGIEVTIDDTKAGSAIVAKGSGLVVVPGTDYLAPVVRIDGQTTIQSGAYAEGILSVNGTVNQADNLTMGAVIKQEVFGSTNGYETIGLDVENKAGYIEDSGMVIGLDLSTYTSGGDGTGTVLGVDAGVEAFGAELAFGVSGVASGANKNVGVFGGVNVDDKTFTDIYANMPAAVDHIGVMAYADVLANELAFYAFGKSEFDGSIDIDGTVDIDGDIDATTGTIVTLDGTSLAYTTGAITTLTGTTATYATVNSTNLNNTNLITTKDLTVTGTATINNLVATTGAITTLTGTTATYTTLNGTTVNSTNLNNSNLIKTKDLVATGDVDALTGTIATLDGASLAYTTGAITTLTGTTATYATVNSTNLNNTNLITTKDLKATGDIDALTGTIVTLDGTSLAYTTGAITTLTGTTATYATVNSTNLNNTNLITTKDLKATGDVDALTGTIVTLDGTTLTYTTGNFTNVNNSNLITTKDLKATGDVDALTGTIVTLDGTALTYTTGNFTNINNSNLIKTKDLVATGDVDALTGTIATLDGTSLIYTNGKIGTLTVTGDASVGGDLEVDGTSTLNDDVIVTGDVDITGDLLVDGDALVTGLLATEDFEANTATIQTLTVDVLATIEDLVVNNDATIGNNLAVTGNTELTGTLEVNDVTTFYAEAIVDNALTINDNAPVNSYVGIAGVPGPGNDGDLFVSRGAGLSPEWSNRLEMLTVEDLTALSLVIDLEDGAAPLVKAPMAPGVRGVDFGAVGMGNGCDVNIYGLLTTDDLFVTGPIAFLEIDQLKVNDLLDITTGTIKADQIEAQDIEVANLTKTNILTVVTDATIAQELSVGTNLTVGGSLEVTGLSTFKSDVTINNGSDLKIPTGGIEVGQNIDVFGGIVNTSSSAGVQQPVKVTDPQGLNVTAGVTANSLNLSTATVAVLGDLKTSTASVINFTAGVDANLQTNLPTGTPGQIIYIVNGSGVNVSILGYAVAPGKVATLVYVSAAWHVI